MPLIRQPSQVSTLLVDILGHARACVRCLMNLSCIEMRPLQVLRCSSNRSRCAQEGPAHARAALERGQLFRPIEWRSVRSPLPDQTDQQIGTCLPLWVCLVQRRWRPPDRAAPLPPCGRSLRARARGWAGGGDCRRNCGVRPPPRVCHGRTTLPPDTPRPRGGAVEARPAPARGGRHPPTCPWGGEVWGDPPVVRRRRRR